MSYIAGLDIGGSKISLSLYQLLEDPELDDSLTLKVQGQTLVVKIVFHKRIATERTKGYKQALSKMINLCQEAKQILSIDFTRDIIALGVGLPGPVDPRMNIMVQGNSGIFLGQNIAGDLKKALAYDRSIFCSNDADCFALAEASYYLGNASDQELRDDATILGVILGTGVGGGCVIHGKPLIGRRGAACEWGHIVLQSGGHPCYCGNLGCVEQYLSGPGFEASFQVRRYSSIDGVPAAAEIFTLAEKQDPIAKAIVFDYKKKLAQFLACLTQSYDPDVIILGGGMSRQDLLYTNMERLIVPYLFLQDRPPFIRKHALADDSGTLGAALLAMARVHLTLYPHQS